MSDHVALDRRQRFEIAGKLWSTCSAVITPARVRHIATQVYDQLDPQADALEVVKRAVEAEGVPAEHIVPVSSLVLLALHDHAEAEVDRYRAHNGAAICSGNGPSP
jgi:hypothetical protein